MSTHTTVEVHPALVTADARTFPLARLAKTPAVKWQQFDGALPAGTLGYGVDCGRSNLVVIDLDQHSEDADGLASWRALVEAHGGTKIGDTFTVNTPNGGLHLYYRAPATRTIKNSAGKLGPGIDVRGKGGYVVGPGSTIKDATGLEATYDVVRDEVVADLPDWLLDLLDAPKPQPVASSLPITHDDFPDTYARRALESAFYVVSTAPSGQRNDALNKEAYGAAKAGAPVVGSAAASRPALSARSALRPPVLPCLVGPR